MTSPQNPWQQGPNPHSAPQAGQPVPPQMPGQPPVNPQAQGYPPAPMGYPQQVPGGRPPRPGTVNFASVLGLSVPPFSAFLSVVTLVIVLVQFGVSFGSSYFWQLIGSTIAFTLAAVVCAVLWIVFSLLMRGGRSWARVVLVVLAALWLVYDLYSIIMFFVVTFPHLAQISGYSTLLIGWLQMFLALVMPVLFMILVFLKPSNDYFKAMRTR